MTSSDYKLTFTAPETLTVNPNSLTSLPDTEVTKLLYMKSMAENIPNAFTSN